MKNLKVVIFILTTFLLGCKGGEPNLLYTYEANPHYAWGYVEFYGPYYATSGVKNNVLTLSLFSDSLKLTDQGALAGFGQYLFLEDIFVSTADTILPNGKYTINETSQPFTVFAGKKDTVDGEVYPIGAYITYYELNSAKSIQKFISSGSFTVNRQDSIFSIVCDFKTSDSLQLKGTYTSELPHIDQSLAPKLFASRNKFLKHLLPSPIMP